MRLGVVRWIRTHSGQLAPYQGLNHAPSVLRHLSDAEHIEQTIQFLHNINSNGSWKSLRESTNSNLARTSMFDEHLN